MQLYIYQGKWAEAEKLYPCLLELKPRNIEILYRYAMLAYRQGAYSNAIDRLCRVEEITGFNEDVILQKKGIYLKMNKSDEAVAELMRIKLAYPRSAEWVLQIADVYQEAGRTADYNRMYAELEKNYPNEPIAQMALIQFYQDRNDTASYRKVMKAIMLNPNLETEQK
ncbi:MAG: tetratricopeptide repeat protein [Bacteroidota bacterium]|nr:MAG: tetratricopeptide repeat protein [Bacteroidota bacterium]